MDEDLRSLHLDNGPRPLRLDKMFLRAEEWESSTPSTSYRPPSPPRRATVFPLPEPLAEENHGVSPLAGLFEYPELIPHVLQYFERPNELATLARVNWGFCNITRKKLYSSIWVRPWEEGCNVKLALLFRTLSSNPELCQIIRKLDVRFFPIGKSGDERFELDEQVVKAIKSMKYLEHLVWTRDKSINHRLVEAISHLPLRSIELSGHSYRYFEPVLLGNLTHLEDLRIMMPDSYFVEDLEAILKVLHDRPMGGIQGLGIICRMSPLVDDEVLKRIGPFLKRLKRFTMWGCPRVSKQGINELLREVEDLQELSIDALHLSMLDLSNLSELPNLTSFSLSFVTHRDQVVRMPCMPPTKLLESLHLTLSAVRRLLPADALSNLQEEIDFQSLRRFSLLNLVIGPQALASILSSAPFLEELYISVNGKAALLDCLPLKGSRLRVFHVNAPEKWGPTVEDLTDLARNMPQLEQIGSGNRVYEISRRYANNDLVVELNRWSKTTIPAYFQVWRG